MKRFLIAAICVGLCALALLSVAHVPAQQSDQAATDTVAKLKALQKERVAMLSQAVKLLKLQYEGAAAVAVDFQQITAAEMDLVNAQIEYSEAPEERIAHLKEGVDVAKAAVQFEENRLRVGYRASPVDLCRLTARYLDIQIKLLKEQQKLASRKGK
jgi:hypothetical protein